MDKYSQLETAATRGGNPEERTASVLGEISQFVQQHAGNPEELRNFANHMRDNGSKLAKSINVKS